MPKKPFILLLFYLILAAGYVSAAIFPIEVPLGIPLSLPHYIQYFFWLAMAVGGIMAVLSLVISGARLILATGDPTKISDAKSQATSAILGLILLLSSFVLIATINSSLENLQPKEDLRHIAIFQFGKSSSGTPQKPAPLSMENLDVIKQDFDTIKWNVSYADLSGNTISNCDPKNPNAVYHIYFYGMPNYNNFIWLERIKCGQAVPLGMAKSYRIIKEEPGVYFFDGPNCSPQILSKHAAFKIHTESIPEDIGIGGETVRSIRIVNGPDGNKGPFYGVIYFNSPDYRTGEGNFGFQHFVFGPNSDLTEEQKHDNNSRCFTGPQFGMGGALLSKGVSFAIYKWAGFSETGAINNPGPGITLFSEVSWGKNTIPGTNNLNLISGTGNTYWTDTDLREVPVRYPPNATAQKARRDQCKFFNPDYSCLQSFEIKGNYLVLVLSRPDIPYTYSQTTKAQVFPVSSRITAAYKDRPDDFSRERGTPELMTDFIGSKSAYFMEIIPLAERLK